METNEIRKDERFFAVIAIILIIVLPAVTIFAMTTDVTKLILG